MRRLNMRPYVHVALAREELHIALAVDEATGSYKILDWDAFMDVWYDILSSRSREYMHDLIMFRDTRLEGDQTLLEFVCQHGSASDEMCSFAAMRGLVAPIELFEQILEIAPDAARKNNPNGLTCLMSCVLKAEASVEVVRLLLAHDPKNTAIQKATSLHQHYPIHEAMSHERMDIVESLLLSDMDGQIALQNKTVRGDTCLHVALQGRVSAKAICNYLSIAPQAARVPNGSGCLPLHTALRSYRRDYVSDEQIEWAMLERIDILRLLLRLYPEALYYPEPESGLVPWMMIASGHCCLPNDPADLANSFELLRMAPDSFNKIYKPDEKFKLAFDKEQQRLQNPYGFVSILAQPGKLDFWKSDDCYLRKD